MKKSVILAVLGLAAGAVSSFGQGSMGFNSYFAGSYGATTVSFAAGAGFTGLVGSGGSAGLFTADVLYSLSPINEAAGSGALTAGWLTSGSGAPSANNLSTPFETGTHAGWFNPGINFVDSTYSGSAAVYFEIIGFNGSSYASATVRGHSDSFSLPLATGIVQAPFSPTYNSWQLFNVAAVPEPTTLALAGLGGLASLVMVRRKKA